jgi:putative oxidoreductase
MDAYLSQHKLHDVVNMGLRAAVGVVFIVHGSGKFHPGCLGFMERLGLPPEMQIPIALAETVPGILLLIGVFTRLSASLLSIVMLGAIFHVTQAGSLTGERGLEIDLLLLAACLVVMIAGPGRISIAHVVKKLPRCLH